MSAYMSREILLFLKSIWYGAFLVLIYDNLRIARNVIRHNTAFSSFEDLCYWIFCALFLFTRYFHENSGILRAYLGAGVILGCIACRISISPYFVKFFTFLWRKIFRVLKIPLKLVKKVTKWLKSVVFRGTLSIKNKTEKLRIKKYFSNIQKGDKNEKKAKQSQAKQSSE